MPQKKKQHYVPQFYLKNFSEDKLRINAYLIKSREAKKQSIRKICYEDYFYSKNPNVELLLSHLENKQSQVIKKIINKEEVETLTIEEALHLFTFISIMRSRNLNYKLKMEKMINLLYEIYMSTYPKEKLKENGLEEGFYKKFKLKWDGMQTYTLLQGIISRSLLTDLDLILFINKTNKEFIISDNPIIFYNRAFFSDNENHLGAASPGLQIFVPLTPELMLMCYDFIYYQIKDKSSYGTKIITESSHIDSLNKLQFYSTNKKTIFYKSPKQMKNIEALHNKIGKMPPKNHIDTDVRLIENRNNVTESIHYQGENIPFELNLDFINVDFTIEPISNARNQTLLQFWREESKDLKIPNIQTKNN